MESFAGIVLAAGKGSRMKSDIPKVLLPLNGSPMVRIVVETLRCSGVSPIVVVISGAGQAVRNALDDKVLFAVQTEPTGTGDACRAALEVLPSDINDVILACGDSPLFRAETVVRLASAHRRQNAVVSLTSAVVESPFGYGRIIRDKCGQILRVAEERHAGESIRQLKEINGGLYAFNVPWLCEQLNHRQRKSGEFVLTEVVQRASAQHQNISSIECEVDEIQGANTETELRAVDAILHRRKEKLFHEEVE